VGRLAVPQKDEIRTIDKKSAEALADTLPHIAELDDWATVTLRVVAQHATQMDEERFGPQCTCGAVDQQQPQPETWQRRETSRDPKAESGPTKCAG
jgi:hypothetical protein